jgi:hypothetical protein
VANNRIDKNVGQKPMTEQIPTVVPIM